MQLQLLLVPGPAQPSSYYPPMERIKQLTAHLTGSAKGLRALDRKSPDDVVITMAIRSPLTKAKKGGFKDTSYVKTPNELLRAQPYYSIDELMLEMFIVSNTYSWTCVSI